MDVGIYLSIITLWLPPVLSCLITAYSLIVSKMAVRSKVSIFTPVAIVAMLFLTLLLFSVLSYNLEVLTIIILILSIGAIAFTKIGIYLLSVMSVTLFMAYWLDSINLISDFVDLSGIKNSGFIFFYYTFVIFIGVCVHWSRHTGNHLQILATYKGFEKRGFYYYHIFSYEIDGVVYNNNASTVEYFKWQEKYSRVKCAISQERVIYVNPRKHEKFIV